MQNKIHTRRVRSLIIMFSLTAIILSVSTYAWFIGMRTVHVASFDVNIAATESLALSLDGQLWSDTVSITKNDFINESDPATTWWADKGLVPMSSIGEMDVVSSRMKIFTKASLSSITGGYKLLASRVDNHSSGSTEQDGYVAFDLYVKNFSGTQYLEELDEGGEEGIYLTADSLVSVAISGVADTGIENSIRVAFAQIGRVIADETDGATIRGITCNADEDENPSIVDGVTGICRTAQIWEPNDTKHVESAIEWYNTTCLKRTIVDETTTYSGACGIVANGISYPTYAVADEIKSTDNVNIYDGAVYNTYGGSVTAGKLGQYDYFTDTKKMLEGTSRPEFMYLAPNSITKIRVYIYMEGQDVDNYDFASIGKAISVKFGFTKQMFDEEDTGYTGPALDPEKPSIILNGNNPMYVIKDATYTEPGATVVDRKDEDLEAVITGTVDVTKIGEYTITYTATDTDGNITVKTRIVNVVAE